MQRKKIRIALKALKLKVAPTYTLETVWYSMYKRQSYSMFTLSWSVKNDNNTPVLHVIVTGVALFNCVWKCTLLYLNLESWTFKRGVRKKTQYIGNGIPFTVHILSVSSPRIPQKFNTQLTSNKWSTQRGCTIVAGLSNTYILTHLYSTHKLLINDQLNVDVL